MPFLRSDAQAPAALLLSFGRFGDAAAAIARFDEIAGELWHDARRQLAALLAASTKPAPELQFRFDIGDRIVRGRFHPTPDEAEAALLGLAAFARLLAADADAALPAAVRIVTAAWDGAGWRCDQARGYARSGEATSGSPMRLRHIDGRWVPS